MKGPIVLPIASALIAVACVFYSAYTLGQSSRDSDVKAEEVRTAAALKIGTDALEVAKRWEANSVLWECVTHKWEREFGVKRSAVEWREIDTKCVQVGAK